MRERLDADLDAAAVHYEPRNLPAGLLRVRRRLMFRLWLVAFWLAWRSERQCRRWRNRAEQGIALCAPHDVSDITEAGA